MTAFFAFLQHPKNSPCHEFDSVRSVDGLAVNELRPLRGGHHLTADKVNGGVGLGDELSADEPSVTNHHAREELKLVFAW